MTRNSVSADLTAVLVTAALCLTVSVIHVLDQGGVTDFAGPPRWLGWGYRAIEIAGIIAAAALVTRRRSPSGWTLSLLVASGPFVGYLLTRTVGLPGDSDDKGHWNDPLGTTSLLVEAVLLLMTVGTLTASRRRAHPPGSDASADSHRLVALSTT